MLKKIGVILLVLVILAVMLVFTRLNPGLIEIDLAFGTIEASIPLAFTIAFAAGWVFGLLCTLAFVARLMNERRRLRKELRSSETELTSLRHRPLADAD